MNSLTPWMKAGTPDVLTVMEGAPPGPVAPRREPRSWLNSGGIPWIWGSLGLVSGWFGGRGVFAVGGVGLEVEKANEDDDDVDDEEVWEDDEKVEEEEEEGVDDWEDVTVWPAVETNNKITDCQLLTNNFKL